MAIHNCMTNIQLIAICMHVMAIPYLPLYDPLQHCMYHSTIHFLISDQLYSDLCPDPANSNGKIQLPILQNSKNLMHATLLSTFTQEGIQIDSQLPSYLEKQKHSPASYMAQLHESCDFNKLCVTSQLYCNKSGQQALVHACVTN